MSIQQLRAQIAALQDATMDENRNFRSAYDEGKFDALSAVDALLDSLQEEPQVKKLAGLQHVNETCKENGNSLTQEPVSKELEEAADNALNNVLNTHEIVNVRSCLEMFKFGAEWQKEKDQRNRTMSKAEKFIIEHTRNCSNELCAVEDRFEKKVISYHEWLTPDQARRAVEIEREEILLNVAEWIKDTFIFSKGAKRDFCQTFNIKLL